VNVSSTRLWVSVSAVVSVLAVAMAFVVGTSASSFSDPPTAKDEAEATLSAHDEPAYWVGRTYDGAHLLEANTGAGWASAAYGEEGCDLDAQFIDAFCFPDLTLETKAAASVAGRPRSTCRRHVGESVVTGCASGEYGVLIGRSIVLVHVSSGSSTRAEQDRLVRALRPVERG